MEAKVFSVVSGVTALDLKLPKWTWEDSVATQLVNQGYADVSEESYCSKMDNEERVSIQEVATRTGAAPGKSVLKRQ